MGLDLSFLSEYGVWILYGGTLGVLILCGMGLPFPEEAVFLAAGYAATKIPESNIAMLCLFGIAGIMAGDSVPFWIGRRHGNDLLQHRWLARLFPPALLDKARAFFGKHGAKTVFCARFVAGLRMPTFFVSATMGVRYWTFFFWDLMGALISCPTSIVVAYYFGPKAEEILAESKHYVFAFAAGLVLAWLVLRVCFKKKEGNSAQVETASPANVAPGTSSPNVVPKAE